MLILRRAGALAIAIGGLLALYLVKPMAAVSDAETLSTLVAIPMASFALAVSLWVDWRPRLARELTPRHRIEREREMRGRAGLWLAVLAGAFAIALLSASRANAETASERAACLPSVLSLCPREAIAGDRTGATRCLYANLTKASAQCQAVVQGVSIAQPRTTRAAAGGPASGRQSLVPQT